jgi:ribosomal protein L18
MTSKAAAFRYREGSRVSGVAPDVAARELARLQRTGPLTARRVLDAARDDASPLHPAFKWDDVDAAEEYRLMQARQLVRSVQVVRPNQPPRSVYVHVSAQDEDEGDYRILETIVNQPAAYTLALAEAQKRLASATDAVDELRQAARGLKDDTYLARVALAAQALTTAEQALRTLH